MDDPAPGRMREIGQELRLVFAGRGNLADALLPSICFLLLNAIAGLELALWGSVGVALLFGVYRLLKRQPWRYALGGLGGVLLAGLIARLLGRSEGFFVPGLVTSALTAALCLVSLIARRPLVAWSSYLARRWPLAWYWHPRVRPAYSEVTLAWLLFFGLRLALQLQFFQKQAAQVLGMLQLISGWPATILLLIASYLYGLWRLANLGGPGVDEFKAGAPPPWQGQKRGF